MGEFLRQRLNARLQDSAVVERITADLERYVPMPPVISLQLNADGTIAIKGEAAEQLKALIREVMESFAQAEFDAKVKQISEEWIKRG